MMNIVSAIAEIVGPQGLLTGKDVSNRPNHSAWTGSCPAKAIVRPASTEELSQVMTLCYQQSQSMVPWGGMSGLVDGITCSADDIAISLERIAAIEHIDSDAGIIRVQAGAILEKVQKAAEETGWLFAVDLGARGSATIGGMISTNAGGNSVIRYGMMREQILGLEVVLADGTVISSMNEMLKNNAGYDLKQLFIGSEGTLGIVTRAVLRLRPEPCAVQTALVALNNFADAVSLLRHLGRAFDGKLSAFEVMWRKHYQYMVEDAGKHQAFLPTIYPYYVLLESAGADAEREEQQFTQVLGDLLEQGAVADAVIAQSGQQAAQLWAMRDDVGLFFTTMGPLAVFDISLPVREMEAYVQGVEQQLKQQFPQARLITFGHLGDGNIHLVIGPAHDKQAVESIVYERLVQVGGSISAEHGIGLQKRSYLPHSRSCAEIQLMKTLKSALDPKHLLNPGKIF